jgi:predicted PurR-regulated permease PerM
MQNQWPRSVRLAFILLALFLGVYAIIVARDFLYPIAFGLLLAYLLYPLVNYLEKKDFPRIISILIGLVLLIGIIYGAGIFIFRRMGGLIDDLPSLKTKAISNIDTIIHSIEDTFGIKDDKLNIALKESVNGMFQSGSESFNRLFKNTTGTIIKILLLPVYIFLFLYYRTKFAHFILKMVAENKRLVMIKILRGVSTVAAKYMGGVFIVASILGVINAIGFSIIGLDYPIFLGIVAAIMSFIPYFGTLMGYVFPFLFALLMMDSPKYGGEVIIQYFIVHFIENNFLTPYIVGNQLSINPFFIIVGLIAAAMVWGIPGMMVIVPMLAIAKIIFENVPTLHPYAYLLGPKGTRKHTLSMENVRKRYNKMKNFFSRIFRRRTLNQV